MSEKDPEVVERVARALWEAVAEGRTEQHWLSPHDIATLTTTAIAAMPR